MRTVSWVWVVLLAGTAVSSCAAENLRGIDKCKPQSKCTLSGDFSVTNDGHAYIGVLTLSDGSCVNVSMPEVRMKQLLYKHTALTVSGWVMQYPTDPEVFSFEVNGRRIGYGLCGYFYLFVPDEEK